MSRARSVLVRCLAVAVGAVAVCASVTPAHATQPVKTVTAGPATISAVTVNGGTTAYGAVTATGTATIAGSYTIGDTGTAIDQIQIGWAGSAAPKACLYNGSGGTSGTFSVNLGKPPVVGDNAVIVNFAQDFSCGTSAWWSSNTGPVIADVAVLPKQTVTLGPVSFSLAGIDALGASFAVRGVDSRPGLRVTYSIADTGGISAGIMVGWAGASAPAGCLYQGPGNQARKTVTFSLGTPPKGYGASYVVAAFYPSCDTTHWATAQRASLAVLYVDRYL